MNRIKKKVISFLMALLMVLGCLPTTVYASTGDTQLSDGDYLVSIYEVKSDGTQEVNYNSMNINPRIVLQVRSGKYTVMAKLRGYDQWSTVEVFDQTKYDSVDTVKAGTNWTGYSGMPMANYSATAETQGDESQNSYWTQINKSTMVDEELHTGIISFSIEDPSETITLGGYAERTINDQTYSVLSVQNYKLDLETIEKSSSLSYLAYGFADGTEFRLDADRFIPIETNIKYDNNNTPSGLFGDEFIESVELAGANGTVTAKFKVSDDTQEEIESIQLLTSTDVNADEINKLPSLYFKAYLLGTRGNIYGDNIYNSETKEFTLEFSGTDSSLSLMTGLDVQIITKENQKGYRAILYLSEAGLSISKYEDTDTDASYSVFSKYAPTVDSIDVKTGEDANEYAVEQIKEVADGDKWRAYTFELQDAEGNSVIPKKGGYVEVPIPSDWDIDNIYIAYYLGTSKNTDSNGGTVYSNCSSIIEKDGKNYLRYKTLSNSWINGGTIVMCQVLKEAELSELQDDGVYSATVKFIKADTDSTLSMANGALETEAYVTIKDGIKEVYLNFHPITMNESDGWYAYLGAIWNKTQNDCIELDYEVNEDGSLLDNAGFDAIDEFPCLKSVKITLSDDTITDNSYTFKVIPPAMGADLTYEEVLSDPIDANLKFYNVKKVDEDTVQIPAYQKSVLRKAIDKAKRYDEASYSAESWEVLKEALKEAEIYYESLSGIDAGTNSEISENIHKKSEAIMNAISGLEENSELKEARENLKAAIDSAKEVELGEKTVSAFNELTSAINSAQAVYERSNVTVEELNEQIDTLNAAVETFKNSPDASELNPEKLEDGEYKVYVDMKQVDKTSNSMSNGAIDHWITLTVEDGNYTATVDFNGMTISGQYGYLLDLKYYEAGYNYTPTGEPSGTLTPVTVLSTQKNSDGSDIIDNYNDADHLYPDVVSFPLVDKGTEEYVPLQVYVPIMESITAGTGTQNVLMKIDWTSLRTADDDTQDVIEFTEDGIYTVSSEIREVGSNEVSAFDQYLDEVRLVVKDGGLTAYIDFKTITDGETENYITEVSIENGEGTGTTGRLERAVLSLPENVEFTKIRMKDNTGAEVEARLYLSLRSAVLQTVDKTALKEYIDKANAVLDDGKTYTEESLTVLKDALETAEAVYADDVAINTEIGSAGLALKNALDTMEEVTQTTVDKTNLKAAIDEAAKISNEDGTYTEESYQALLEALDAAEAVYQNEDATQSEVDSQTALLKAAVEALKETVQSDKDNLKDAIAKAESLNDQKDTYTEDSWNALYAVYSAAVSVYEDSEASQAEIDTQTELLLSAIDALITVSDAVLSDGLYQINGEIVNATDPSRISMADSALEYTIDEDGNKVKNPLYIVVKDGQAYVRLRFVELSSELGGQAFSGYLGELKYYPDFDDTDTVPGADEELADVIVEYSYQGYDQYNDPDFGTDSYMKGKSYPEQVLIPIEAGDTEVWLKLYVPVMEAISSGSGTQQARLRLDWSEESFIQVRDESIDVSKLEQQISYAKALEKGIASDATWEALQSSITAAEAVYNNLSATQEQVDAQITLLQKAMAAVQAENGNAADKTQLQSLIASAEEALEKTDTYTSESLETLETILAYAQSVYENADADQETVNAAVNALSGAIDGLVQVTSVDTSVLEYEIANAEKLAKQTDVYTAESLQTLQIAINNAKRVLADDAKTQETVDKQVTALQNAQKGLIEKVTADKSGLKTKIEEARTYLENESKYTASTISRLKTAINNAQTVYNDETASQTAVDAQVTALNNAINALEIAGDTTLDLTDLADGVYSIYGEMVKTDKTSESMSNAAINHTIKLTVEDGKYYITMNFNGLQYAGQYGYLKDLQYFLTGYTTNQYGVPQGDLADVTIDSYQTDEDGNRVSDSFGTDYPDYVTFELIPEALEDGFVPLQVFVPIMESIADGTGTQAVYLKLDWSSLKLTEADDPDFEDDGNNDNNNNNNNNGNGNGGSGLSGGSGLGNNTLGSTLGGSSLGGSSLGGSSLKSGSSLTGASSVKTDDTSSDISGWAAVLAIGCMALLVGVLEKRSQKKNKGM